MYLNNFIMPNWYNI